jgi:hypothetical protein
MFDVETTTTKTRCSNARVEEPTRLEGSISMRLERYCVDNTKNA